MLIESFGKDPERVVKLLPPATGITEDRAEGMVHSGFALTPGLPPQAARTLAANLKSAGATVKLVELETSNWPKPYIQSMNPLSIDLTAINTFILICSSVTMVFALSAIQQGNKRKSSLFLLATVLIGSLFLSIQVKEYYELMKGHPWPVGISQTGHFTPDVSLFASCFFTMTGFHGAHVTGGVIMLACIWVQSLRGVYTRERHSPVELAGLYWHFVDLVWIILFTVVYLI